MELPQRRTNLPLKFVSVGRFIKRKNYAWMLEALSKVDCPRFELEIYGHGPEQTELQRIIDSLGLHHVRLCEERPKEEILRIMRDADALIHPSHIEGLPNVVIESITVGTPVMVSNIDPHFDIVRHGYEGYIFDLNDPGSLARLIDSFVGTPMRLSGLSANCLVSSERFTLSRKIQRYHELYREALETLRVP